MELHRDSRLIWWAYQLEPAPRYVSVCALFWRSVLLTPLLWLLLLVFLPVMAPAMLWEKYGQEPYRQWRRQRRGRALERQRQSGPFRAGTPAWRVLWEGLKAVKGKVCPMIEVTEESLIEHHDR